MTTLAARAARFLTAGCAMLGLVVLASAPGCNRPSTSMTVAATPVRAARRAYDGAPPVIPHPPLGAACSRCHHQEAQSVPGVGMAPANPHLGTPLGAAAANCRQCHVFAQTESLFVKTQFVGDPQRVEGGQRLYPGAPPVIPHRIFMRENCLACHSGKASRPEIRCSHPERSHCQQCHIQQTTTNLYVELSPD